MHVNMHLNEVGHAPIAHIMIVFLLRGLDRTNMPVLNVKKPSLHCGEMQHGFGMAGVD
jgi:hypothetical protein